MRAGLRVGLVVLTLGAALAVASPAGGARECDGLMVCVSVAGPWVVVPNETGAERRNVEFQLTCPRRHVVGGLDAELSRRGIDVQFLGKLGSPVNPGITTSRSVVFLASFVGRSAGTASFRPYIGCMPVAGGGVRVPTAVGIVRPGEPTVRRVRTVRVRPGTQRVTQRCVGRERLVHASHAFGFFMRRPPDSNLAASVSATSAVRGDSVVVDVRGDAELGDVRAVVQVHALCSRSR